MLLLRKINPVEFRLHQKPFNTDISPSNYYASFKYEILIQKLLRAYCQVFGMYLFLQKFHHFPHHFLIQFFYYRTRLAHKAKARYSVLTRVRHSVNPWKGRRNKKRWKRRRLKKSRFRKKVFSIKVKKSLPKYFLKLIALFRFKKLRIVRIRKRRFKKKHWLRFKKKHKRRRWMPKPQYLRFKARQAIIRNQKMLKAARRVKYSKKKFWARGRGFQYFFNHFFNYFFFKPVIVLYKSLYKLLHLNPRVKSELFLVLSRSRYLQRSNNWLFDLVFAWQYTLLYANTNFLLPYFIRILVIQRSHYKLVTSFFHILRMFFILQKNIKGAVIFIKGEYDKHARSRTTVFKAGTLSVVKHRSFILYDALQCPTFYGTFHLKMWVHIGDKQTVYSNFDEII